MKLSPTFAPAFKRDIKRLQKKRIPLTELDEVIELILANTPEAHMILRQRHRMHSLKGTWAGTRECHVANTGDWLLIWMTTVSTAFFMRTGTHAEVFRSDPPAIPQADPADAPTEREG